MLALAHINAPGNVGRHIAASFENQLPGVCTS